MRGYILVECTSCGYRYKHYYNNDNGCPRCGSKMVIPITVRRSFKTGVDR